MDLFEHLKNLTERKIPPDIENPEFESSYNPYMINRFVSMVEYYLPIVSTINNQRNIPKDIHYQYYFNLLPKKNHFFRYIKSKKDEVREEQKEILMEHFEFGSRDLEKALKILTIDQIKHITGKYEHGKVKIHPTKNK